MNLNEATQMNEEQAREFIESILWPEGPVCPRCETLGAWKIKGESVRAGLYKCTCCREPFTVTIGTVMESSHISLRQWLLAFHLMISSKKGVSALQLKRNLGLGCYQSAWHLAHRIRLSMNENPLLKLLKGTVEVDETYVGGKPRKENKRGSGISESEPKKRSKRGRGTEKTPVLALVERNGKVVSKTLEHPDAKTLKGAIKEICHKDSCIMTDESASYTGIGTDFNGGHEVVKHNDGEFKRENGGTNTVESYFALLKRGVHVSSIMSLSIIFSATVMNSLSVGTTIGRLMMAKGLWL